MTIDKNGNVTIKCNKYFIHLESRNCFNRTTSLCPLIAIGKRRYSSDLNDNVCNEGIVTLEWTDYIKFNNNMLEIDEMIKEIRNESTMQILCK